MVVVVAECMRRGGGGGVGEMDGGWGAVLVLDPESCGKMLA
jgi:hypothetical protein